MNRFFNLLIAIVFIAALWTGAWFFGAFQIQNAYENLRVNLAEQGTEIACADLKIDGLPFRYDIECLNFSVTQEDVKISAPNLAASLRVYQPTHIVISAQSPIKIEDQFWGIQRELSFDSAQLSARTNGFALARVSFLASGIALDDNLFGQKRLASADTAEAHILDLPQFYDETQNLATWSILAAASNVEAPDLTISQGALTARAEMDGLPDDLRNLDLRTIAKRWMDPTSGIRIEKIELSDSQTKLDIVGQLGMSENLAWQGDFDLFSRGLDERLATSVPAPLRAIYIGNKGDDGSHYRAYAVRHNVIMAGNLPLFVLPAPF